MVGVVSVEGGDGSQEVITAIVLVDAHCLRPPDRVLVWKEGAKSPLPNLFLELKTKLKGIIFYFLNLFCFILYCALDSELTPPAPGNTHPKRGQMRCYRMKRNAMKSNSIRVISLRLDFFEGPSNMFSVAAGEFLVLECQRPGVTGSG